MKEDLAGVQKSRYLEHVPVSGVGVGEKVGLIDGNHVGDVVGSTEGGLVDIE